MVNSQKVFFNFKFSKYVFIIDFCSKEQKFVFKNSFQISIYFFYAT